MIHIFKYLVRTLSFHHSQGVNINLFELDTYDPKYILTILTIVINKWVEKFRNLLIAKYLLFTPVRISPLRIWQEKKNKKKTLRGLLEFLRLTASIGWLVQKGSEDTEKPQAAESLARTGKTKKVVPVGLIDS